MNTGFIESASGSFFGGLLRVLSPVARGVMGVLTAILPPHIALAGFGFYLLFMWWLEAAWIVLRWMPSLAGFALYAVPLYLWIPYGFVSIPLIALIVAGLCVGYFFAPDGVLKTAISYFIPVAGEFIRRGKKKVKTAGRDMAWSVLVDAGVMTEEAVLTVRPDVWLDDRPDGTMVLEVRQPLPGISVSVMERYLQPMVDLLAAGSAVITNLGGGAMMITFYQPVYLSPEQENGRAFLASTGVIAREKLDELNADVSLTNAAADQRTLLIRGGIPGITPADLVRRVRAFEASLGAVSSAGEVNGAGDVRIVFYLVDPLTPQEKAGREFLVKAGFLTEDAIKDIQPSVSLSDEQNGQRELLLKVPLSGMTFGDYARRVEGFADRVGAGGAVSERTADGGILTRFFVKNPLDAAVVLDAPAPLDSKSMTVECAVDTFGRPAFVEMGGASGMVVGGVPGSGKTAGVSTFLLPLALEPSVSLSIIDGKGGSDWEPYEGAAEAYLRGDDDLEAVRDLLRGKVAEMDARMRGIKAALGTSNYWAASPEKRLAAGLPMELVVIDECQSYFELEKNRERDAIRGEITHLVSNLIRRGRSAGMFVILLTQRPTVDTIPARIRDNCGVRISFRVSNAVSAVAVLGDMPDDAPSSASPTAIPASRKGGAVLADDAGSLKPVRFYYLPEDVQARLLASAPKKVFRRLTDQAPVSPAYDGADVEDADGGFGWVR